MFPFSHVPSADPLPILLILLLGWKSPAVFEYKSRDRSPSPIVTALIPIPIILSFPYHLNRCPNNFFSHKLQWSMECPGKRWDGEGNGRSGRGIYSWFPPPGSIIKWMSQLLLGGPLCLQCQELQPMLPLQVWRRNGASSVLVPGSLRCSCSCGFSSLCALLNSSQSIPTGGYHLFPAGSP